MQWRIQIGLSDMEEIATQVLYSPFVELPATQQVLIIPKK
jgi:hypothetical protein